MPKLNPALQSCLTSAEYKGRIIFLNLLEVLFLMQARRLMAIFAIREHCWILFNLVSTGTLRFSPAVLLSSLSALYYLNPADSGWHFQLFLFFFFFLCLMCLWQLFLCADYLVILHNYTIELIKLSSWNHVLWKAVHRRRLSEACTKMEHVTHLTYWGLFPPFFSRLNVK